MSKNLIFEVYLFLSISFGFSIESLKGKKKLANKITHFTIQISLKTLPFYEPQFTQHCKKYAPATQPKTLITLQIFKQTYF